MEVDLFDDGGQPEGHDNAAKEPTQPQAPTTPSNPDYEARLAAMEGTLQSTNQALRQTSEVVQNLAKFLQEGVQASTKEQPSGPADPKAHNEALLNRLATDPEGLITELASRVVEDQTRSAISPALLQILDTAHHQLLDSQALSFDSQFGAGAWREIIEPGIQEDLKALRSANPKALADRNTIQALVDRQRGINFDTLVKKREDHAKALATQREQGLKEIVSQIPVGSVPRLRSESGEGALPSDADPFLRSIEASTGEAIDRKEFTRLYNSGNSLTDFLKATAKPNGRGTHA